MPTRFASSAPSTSAIAPAKELRFGGWDPDFGEYVFRTHLSIAATGHVTGSLDFARVTRRGLHAKSFTLAGTAAPPEASSERRRLRLQLSRPLKGGRVLSGHVDPRHIELRLSPETAEIRLYGSSFAVASKYRARKHILAGPGGYVGWLRRQRTRQAAVQHVDMDGDGRRDLVAVVWSRLTDPQRGVGSRRVLVHFANGATASVEVPARNTGGPVGWVGSVKLPGLAGRQIVLRLGSGAANVFYDVIAARDGVLTTIAAPEPDYAWNEGGTVGTGTHGRFCRGGTLHAWYARGVVRHGHYVGERLTLKRYVWGGSAWQLVSGFSGRVGDRRLRSLLRVPKDGLWGCG